MNEIKVFDNEEFGQVRTVVIDNEPWFVGKDIASALGYVKERNAISAHVDDEDKKVAPIQGTLGGIQDMTIINESGLYSLVLSSKLPSAKKFKRWITSEVIPSIRKHGAYMTEDVLQKAITSPDFLIQLATELKNEQAKRRQLEVEVVDLSNTISELEPKANYVDIVLASKETVTVTQIAQDYGMSAQKLNKQLADMHIQYKVNRQWILYSEYLKQGYVHSKTVEIERSNGMRDTVLNTEWTQKGRLFLYEKLKAVGIYPLIERDVA